MKSGIFNSLTSLILKWRKRLTKKISSVDEMDKRAIDRKYMEEAIKEMYLSRLEHKNKTDPLVGAVLVNTEGRELAKTHRGEFGQGDHAEFTIFDKIIPHKFPAGCILYVTLEPCTKRSRTKISCFDWIVRNGIKRVVIGIRDPNPDVSGGVEYLRNHGISVDFFDQDLAEEISNANKGFLDSFKKEIKEKEKNMDIELQQPSREEKRPIPEADTTDLSEEAIKKYLDEKDLSFDIPSEELWDFLAKSGFLRTQDEKLIPTLAAIILFAKNPEQFAPESYIEAECFSGNPKDGSALQNLTAREEIGGPLSFKVDSLEEFFMKNVQKVSMKKGTYRDDAVTEYPWISIREAVVNALVHRDYSVAAHVIFKMYRDRIVVKSPGPLVAPNTLEKIRKFDVVSVRRNERIADVAASLKLMERRGGGIPNLPQELKDHGLGPPSFDYENGYFVVTFPGRALTSPRFKFSKETLSKCNKRQLKVLDYIWENGSIKRSDADEFGVNGETLYRDFKKLEKLGVIEKKGQGQDIHYVLI